MSPALASLPYVDQHSVTIEAGSEPSWMALQRVLEATGTVWLVRILGCVPATASGPRPFAEGSAIRGFRVSGVKGSTELTLTGRHRFSDYALIFRLDQLDPGHTRLRAETRARFPGVKGAIYRTLVISSRAHVLATRRILAAVKREAERSP